MKHQTERVLVGGILAYKNPQAQDLENSNILIGRFQMTSQLYQNMHKVKQLPQLPCDIENQS